MADTEGGAAAAVEATKVEATKVEEPVKAEGANKEEGDGDEEVTNYESTAVFQPVVQLQEVETKTHEEEEDALYKQRSKLFVFGEAILDRGSGKKSWLERGVGEMKILKHRENGRIRVLMRQEKTMKVIANHVVDPRITMTPNVGSDKSWVWTAFDYSEGDLKEEVFALKFGKAEDANEFKKYFEEAKEVMKAFMPTADEEPQSEGDAKAADDASDALSGLDLKTKNTDKEGGAADPATTTN